MCVLVCFDILNSSIISIIIFILLIIDSVVSVVGPVDVGKSYAKRAGWGFGKWAAICV